MEKSRYHSADNRCIPALKDLQKASQDEISSRSTLARCQTDEETGQVMNRCLQVSSALAHSAQPAATSGITRCRNALVFRRLRRRSQANMRIFSNNRLFHAARHSHKSVGSSVAAYSRRRWSTARAKKRGSCHTHASGPSDGWQSPSNFCILIRSSARWFENVAGKAMAHASCQAWQTGPCWSRARANRRGKFRLILPCQDQSSNQKRNDSPDPSLGRKKCRTAWKMGRKEDKNAESPLLGVCQSCQSSVCPYSSLNTDVTTSPVRLSIRLTHLDNRVVLVCITCRTPKPPWSTRRHKVSHGTKAIPWDSSFRGPRQKKYLMLRSKRLRTQTGILKMDIKYIGMAARTALRSTRRPPPPRKQACSLVCEARLNLLEHLLPILCTEPPIYQWQTQVVNREGTSWCSQYPGTPRQLLGRQSESNE